MIKFDHLNCRINEFGIDPAKVNIHGGAIALGYVFLSIVELDCNRENYGNPFKYRQYFMGKLCDDVKVKRFGFHAIRYLTASILYKL